MASEKFTVLSVQKGPLEGGGEYRSMWVTPAEFENRGAPHITRGPVPIKIDCSEDAINQVLAAAPDLPALFSFDMSIKVSGGNKSKAYINSASLASSSVDKAPVSSTGPKVVEKSQQAAA